MWLHFQVLASTFIANINSGKIQLQPKSIFFLNNASFKILYFTLKALFIFIGPYTYIYHTTRYCRDRYEIIGLLKLSHSIKQPCSSVCLKKAPEMY